MGLEKDKQNYHTMGDRGGQCARPAFNLRFSEYINPFDATLESRIPGITGQVFTPESEIQYLNTLAQSLVQGRGEESECYCAVFTEALCLHRITLSNSNDHCAEVLAMVVVSHGLQGRSFCFDPRQ